LRKASRVEEAVVVGSSAGRVVEDEVSGRDSKVEEAPTIVGVEVGSGKVMGVEAGVEEGVFSDKAGGVVGAEPEGGLITRGVMGRTEGSEGVERGLSMKFKIVELVASNSIKSLSGFKSRTVATRGFCQERLVKESALERVKALVGK
jgi:hypothetical protein